jgi:hypothetical protein
MLRARERSPFAAINSATFFTMLSKLEVSSVALAKINEANLPDGFASGCLMDYHGRRLLLTVAHATHKGPPLALALGWDPALRRVKLWRFGGLNFLARGQLSTGIKLQEMKLDEVDFAYVDVPSEHEPRLEKIDAQTGNIVESRACTIWPATAIAEPEAGVRYGFAGHTKPSLEDHALIAADVKFCFTELRVCFPLSFVEQREDLFAFRLPVEHPGHEYFRGCSGAPIIDDEGRVVALVCEGSVEDSIIYGVSLRRYQVALDVHIGRLG